MKVKCMSGRRSKVATEKAALGLHFCKRYQNLVRYDPEFCGACPFNGLRPLKKEDTPETCF
jgi:hypothetical protein